MKFWNRLEQSFKHGQLRFFERLLGLRPCDPALIDHAAIRRILVVRQHDQLGDFLLSTPVFKAVRQRYPQAHITVVTRSYTARVADFNEYIDAVVPVFEHGGDWNLNRLAALLRLLRHKADLAIVLNTVSHSLTSDLIARFGARRWVLGSEHRRFAGTSRNFFYSLLAPHPEEPRHQSQRNLDIVHYIGIQGEDLHEHMRLRPEELAWAAAHLAELGREPGRPLVAIHPGAGKLANRWPASRFAAAANQLAREFNAQIWLTWGARETELGTEILAALDKSALCSSHPDIRKMAAILAAAHLFLCNDTGVMHVGAAVGTPLVAVFGPTDPAQWKPWGDEFVAVRTADGRCESVGLDLVLPPARALLQSSLR